jgi:MFS family permease
VGRDPTSQECSKPMSAEDRPKDSVLRHRSFAFFWASRVAASLSSQMQQVAVGWQIYELTHDPFDLGLVGLAQFFPLVAFMLLAGHFADRYDRRNVVRLAQLADAGAMAVLAAGAFGGWLNREWILAMVFVFGTARVFQQPAQQTMLPSIVPAGLLSRAVAASSSSNQIATIIGPALGGLLLAFSPAVVYTLCALLYGCAAVMTSFITLRTVPAEREPVTFASVFAGIDFIRRHPIILGAITLDLFAVLLGGATALLPIYAQDILQTGAVGLGLLRVAPAVGAIGITIFLSRWPMRHHAGYIMFGTVAIFGLATIVFGVSTSLPLTLAALMVLGASDVISVVIRQTLVQLGTPDNMRGRVSAVNSLFIGTSNQLGEFESGLTASWFGTVPAVVIGGVGTILVVLVSMKLFPELARINSVEDAQRQK